MINWAWVAGFYEAEGNIETHKVKGVDHYPALTIVQSNREVLSRILAFVRYGKIYPRRHKKKKHHSKSWMFRLAGKPKIISFFKRIKPYMNHPEKIKQFDRVLERMS